MKITEGETLLSVALLAIELMVLPTIWPNGFENQCAPGGLHFSSFTGTFVNLTSLPVLLPYLPYRCLALLTNLGPLLGPSLFTLYGIISACGKRWPSSLWNWQCYYTRVDETMPCVYTAHGSRSEN